MRQYLPAIPRDAKIASVQQRAFLARAHRCIRDGALPTHRPDLLQNIHRAANNVPWVGGVWGLGDAYIQAEYCYRRLIGVTPQEFRSVILGCGGDAYLGMGIEMFRRKLRGGTHASNGYMPPWIQTALSVVWAQDTVGSWAALTDAFSQTMSAFVLALTHAEVQRGVDDPRPGIDAQTMAGLESAFARLQQLAAECCGSRCRSCRIVNVRYHIPAR